MNNNIKNNIMHDFDYSLIQGYGKAPKYDQGLGFYSYKEKRRQKKKCSHK